MIGSYFIGAPGAGKSTLLRALTAGIDHEARSKPFAHMLYFGPDGRPQAAQLGADDPMFPGTDRLSMSVQPKAIDWLWGAPAPVVFGEGDRLASAGFLRAMEDTCDEWDLFLVDTPPELAAARRSDRGTSQSAAWLKGRETKTARIAGEWDHRLVVLDGSQPVDKLVAQVRLRLTWAWSDLGK